MTYKVAQKLIPKNTETDPSINQIVEYGSVVQLGIQGAPGTKFVLNEGGAITLGTYGIYELDLTGGIGKVISISFPKQTLVEDVYIDMVYEVWED